MTKEQLQYIQPSIANRAVPHKTAENKATPPLRVEKAREQLEMKRVSKKTIKTLVNKYLALIGMPGCDSPEVHPAGKTGDRGRIRYSEIYEKNKDSGMADPRDIVWIKFDKLEDESHIISVIGTGCDIFFTQKTRDTTASGRINEWLDLEWDDSEVFIFPLKNIPVGLTRNDIESGIGNYLISNKVPILDFYSHNY